MTAHRSGDRRSTDVGDLTVLRYVAGTSVVHRLPALAKVIALVVVTFSLAISPSWWAVGSLAVVAAGGMRLAGLPLGVLPRPPRILWIAIGISAGLAATAGGDPYGFGGLLVFGRLMGLTVVVLVLAGLVGWTTPAAELAPAIGRFLSPLRAWPFRRLGVDVDELVATLALCVRVMPLLIEEFRILVAVQRHRPAPQGRKGRIADAIESFTAATVAAVRRAAELGRAIQARGGSRPPDVPVRLGTAGWVVVLAAVVLAVALVTGPLIVA